MNDKPGRIGHGLLRELLEHGAIEWSRVPGQARKELDRFIRFGFLNKEKVGAGYRLRVAKKDLFETFVRNEYPGALPGKELDFVELTSPRARGVALHRNSKHVRGTLGEPVFIRGGVGALFVGQDRGVDLKDVEVFGGHGFILRDVDRWKVTGPRNRVGLIENLDPFLALDIEAMVEVLDLDAVIFLHGVMSGRVLQWLASPGMSHNSYLHFGDYDPVGLLEYLRLREAVSENRAQLYLPADLPGFFDRHKGAVLLKKERNVLALRKLAAKEGTLPPEVQRVVTEIRRTNKCVEQEALLVESFGEGRNPFCVL